MEPLTATPVASSERRSVDDQELIDAFRQGDASAFEELYRRHHPAVLRRLTRVCGNESVAEELAQEAFLRAAQELAVDPQRCVVVEDSLHGTLAALAAGMRVILCPCEVTSHCNFPQGPYRVGSLLEVSLSHLEDDDLGRSGVTIADAAQQ